MTFDSASWERVERLFHDALELPPSRRQAFLDASSEDPRIRSEVESLLASHPDAHSFIGRVIAEEARAGLDTALDAPTPHRLGPYEIETELGRGGMGTVYRARRADRLYEHRVAIKVVRGGFVDSSRIARFRSERQILASLTHPNIAQLLDGGETGDGLPYLVMEYVDGRPIDVYCDAEHLDIRARLRLFLSVCAAVQHAHSRLVIHRDLKPSNILVTGDGTVKLLDFGIAKLLDVDQPVLVRTMSMERLLTPEFASPEQVRGEIITIATDVYALGVVLYELLAGARPYVFEGGSAAEIERVVTESEPPAMSDAVVAAEVGTRSSIAAARSTGVDALRRALRGDLDNVVACALHKDPERRYVGVEQLASDIRRHLDGHTIQARPDTLGYRVSTLLRRNRPIVAGALAVLLALVIGLVATTIQSHRATVARREAERIAYAASLSAAESSLRADQIDEARRQLERAPAALRGWEWNHLAGRLDRSERSFPAHEGGVTDIAFTPDGTVVWSCGIDGRIVSHTRDEGRPLTEIGPLGAAVESIDLSPDGTWLAAGLNDGRVLLTDATTPSANDPVELYRGDGWARVCFHPSGKSLVAGLYRGDLATLSIPEGRVLGRASLDGYFALPLYLGSGERLAVGTSRGLWIVDPDTFEPQRALEGHTRRVISLASSGSGDLLASGSMDQTARVWRLGDDAPPVVFGRHDATVTGLAFDPLGTDLVSSGADRRVLRWDSATGNLLARLRGHQSDVFAVAFSPDGRHVAAGAWDGTLLVFDRDAADVPTLHLATSGMSIPIAEAVAVDPMGRWVAVVSGELEVFDRHTRVRHAPLESPLAHGLAVTGDGSRLLLPLDDGDVAVVLMPDEALEAILETEVVRVLAADPADDRMALACADGGLRVVSVKGDLLAEVRSDGVGAIAFSPDGRRLAVGDDDGRVILRDADTMQPITTLAAHEDSVTSIVFAPSGRELVTTSADGSARIWDATDGTSIAVLMAHSAAMNAATYLAAGTRIAVGGVDEVVRIYETSSYTELVRLSGHFGGILDMVEDRSTGALVTASRDGTVRIWD